MIILDEEAQRKQLTDPYAGSPMLRFPEKIIARTDHSLPDYETSEARQKLFSECPPRWWKRDAKLWKAIGIAFALYVLLSIIVGIPIFVMLRKKNSLEDIDTSFEASFGWSEGSDPGFSLNVANTNPWMLPLATRCDVDLMQISKLTNTLTAEATHSIDSAGSLYIRSNISFTDPYLNFSIGNLTVDLNPDPHALETLVYINLLASQEALLHETGACLGTVAKYTVIFLYASRNLNQYESLLFGVRVLLPQDSSKQLDNLITFLPWFSHMFGDLAPSAIFDSVLVEGAGFDISAKSLKASKIIVYNAYGSIQGNFHVTDGLTLDGIRSNITTNVTLEHAYGRLYPTHLTMITGEGSINSSVTLIPSVAQNYTNSSTYAFVADIETSNAPLDLQLLSAPLTPPAPIQLSVRNNEGRTGVIVDSNYQGTYFAHCKLDTVKVTAFYAPPSEDPSGLSRSRSMMCDADSTNLANGWVGWGVRPQTGEVQGNLKISSSLSPVYLQLGTNSLQYSDVTGPQVVNPDV